MALALHPLTAAHRPERVVVRKFGRGGKRVTRRFFCATALAVAACAVWAPVSAQALPPVLTSVDQVNRHLTATWTLPVGTTSDFVEVATSSQVDAAGFFTDLVYQTGFSPCNPFTSTVQFAPGTYYAPVGGC